MFEVRVVGGRVTVRLDGKPVTDYHGEPAAGDRLGLHKNKGRIAFRNIRLKPLP
jgi:hypothetical protein